MINNCAVLQYRSACCILTSPGSPSLANRVLSLHVTSHNAHACDQIKISDGELESLSGTDKPLYSR